MSNLKCPFCGEELDCMGKYTDGSSKWLCNKCGLFGDKKLFNEIIRTRKALDVAVDALNKYEWNGSFDHNGEFNLDLKEMTLAHKALEQITALEQKEEK